MDSEAAILDGPPDRAERRVDPFPIPLGRGIVDMNVWAIEQGLRGATARDLFDGFCQLLVAGGMPLLRGYVSTQTLHPQWSGYGYTWRRDLNAVYEQQFPRGAASQQWRDSPFYAVIARARAGERAPWLRRRLELGPEQRDFPALRDFHAAGATDYLCVGYIFGEGGDPAHGAGVVYSFTTDRPGGFNDEELQVLRSTLPGLSLAMKAHAGYDIASGLLQTYLGQDAGRRVHSGDVERGSVNGLSAVLWYADIRAFTRVSDASPGHVIVALLDEVFETMTAALRPRGGQVLKFIGDAMLATLAFDEADQAKTCRLALDAAVEAMAALETLNKARDVLGLPTVGVDLALHVGEVLYGNVGAADRLDFTVIGPAVNEVARIEKLCDLLDRRILVSAPFAAAAGHCDGRLQSLGSFALRGVSERKEIFGLAPRGVAAQDGALSAKPL